MYMMITRKELGKDEVLPPDADKITLEQAIRSYTIDAAYLMEFESFTGSIEVGKRADLVVVDRDISRRNGGHRRAQHDGQRPHRLRSVQPAGSTRCDRSQADAGHWCY